MARPAWMISKVAALTAPLLLVDFLRGVKTDPVVLPPRLRCPVRTSYQASRAQ